MIQRLAAFFLLLSISAPCAMAADTRSQATTAPVSKPQASKPAKNLEQRFLDGRACLIQADTGCAQVALAGINPASSYAKILEAQIAATHGDFDTVLRLLIPLQAETGLLPQAYASLHATLAQAYAAQKNMLRAAEQLAQAEPFLGSQEEINANQSQLWELLARQPRETLVEMRGESPDTVMQGWIDLALAHSYAEQRSRYIEQWRTAYPDHPASAALLREIAASATPVADSVTASGKVALLLPLDAPDYAAAAQAVLAGFETAHTVVGYPVDFQIYPTDGTPDMAVLIYRDALQDGAQFVVGPLIRDEVDALIASDLITVPTLALNQPEDAIKLPEKLLAYGLAVENEARQAAQSARQAGMQSAIIIVAESLLSKRMAKAFTDKWLAEDGTAPRQLQLPADDKLAELKAEIAAQPADMFFLATSIIDALRVKPYLDPATPTFGISHLYDGNAIDAQNQALSAVHFIDMPWMLDPDNREFAPYRASAAEFGKGWPQRWFALGVDVYRLLPFLAEKQVPGRHVLHGLSGNIGIDENGRFTRELALGQFRPGGVALERPAP